MSVKVLEETLNTVFTSMTDGKAKTFSDGIANAVVVFVSTDGSGNLLGSKGSGSFSFIDSA